MPEPPPNHVHPLTRDAWRAWLEQAHAREEGVWLVRYKKATGKPTLSYDEAVEEAICFGWVDSLPRKLDDERSLLYVAPRKPGSGWSRRNKERMAKMAEAGKMAPAGLAKVAAAKADGSWSALDAVENLVVPDDLAAAFEAHPGAAAEWEAFPRSAKRGILEWIQNAKRDPTRRKRVEETARLAQRGERANQWPRKS
ncbi:MAG: YdeI/OmpD-associated family protein [Rubricoccaceae bacterium]|nr:YdeI/OmpD-associated family protein [Rubricoccaceae bacterium]